MTSPIQGLWIMTVLKINQTQHRIEGFFNRSCILISLASYRLIVFKRCIPFAHNVAVGIKDNQNLWTQIAVANENGTRDNERKGALRQNFYCRMECPTGRRNLDESCLFWEYRQEHWTTSHRNLTRNITIHSFCLWAIHLRRRAAQASLQQPYKKKREKTLLAIKRSEKPAHPIKTEDKSIHTQVPA